MSQTYFRRSYEINNNGDSEQQKLANSKSSPIDVSPAIETTSIALPSEPPTQSQSAIQKVDTAIAVESQRLSSDFGSAEKLSILKSNINSMADQLQTLLEKEEAAATVARLLNQITFRLRESRSTNEVFSTAVEEAREALQSDRVIVYAFDANWKGTVVAESVAPGWKAALAEPREAQHSGEAECLDESLVGS